MHDPTGQDFDQSLSTILKALEHIKRNMPNGELKSLQEKFSTLEKNQDDFKEEIRTLKKILLDPEEGVIVKLNKSIKLAEDQEKYRTEVVAKKLETLNQIESWKEGVTKVLWILFATIAGIVLNLFLKK